MLSNIQSFEWTPTKNLMVIIGSNGSGKSSLLSELSPLPSHHTEFDKGIDAGKTWHGMHKNSRYELVSIYDKGTGHHSFKKDDVELNEGRTYQVQIDLCKQEFGLTFDIEDIITGRTKFSQLPTNKRRDWLTRMSPVDLGYAFNLLSKVDDEARGQKKVVDHMTKRLVNENVDMIDMSEIGRLKTERTRLTDRVNRLFLFRDQSTRKQFHHDSDAQTELTNILNKAKALLKRYPRLSDSTKLSGVGEFQEQVNGRLSELNAAQAVTDHMIEDLDKLRATAPAQVERMSPEDIQELKDRLNDYLQQSSDYMSVVNGYSGEPPLCQVGVFGDPLAKLDDAFDRAFTLMSSIPNNPDGEMSTARYRDVRAQLDEAKQKLRHCEEIISTCLRRIASLKGCEHVECPNCKHSFAPGVDISELPKVEERLRQATAGEERYKAEIKTCEEYLDRYQDYAGYVQQFQQITRDHRDFDTVWSWMVGGERLFRKPREYTNDLVRWHSAQRAMVQAETANEHIKTLRNQLAAIEAIDFDAAGYIQERTVKLDREINDKLLAQQATREQLEAFMRSGKAIEDYQTELLQCVAMYEQWVEKAKRHAAWLIDSAFEQEIRATHQQLGATESQLHEATRRETEIMLLQETVADSADALADLQLLSKALSPKGGLIGQYMLGFLQGVCQLVNAVIDEVWTYPLVVLPAKIDRDDIDYKFPMSVGDGAVNPPDIDCGSDSQKEIVNFAFMCSMMLYLGLEEYPLFLDEFGRTFDEAHRTRLVPFITRLIEMQNFRQIFYISHFESTHGAFNQAEVIVMDPTNVTVPVVYNKNVVIKN
jgi:DNA repair exonuclease SbcCD ATPase subunit